MFMDMASYAEITVCADANTLAACDHPLKCQTGQIIRARAEAKARARAWVNVRRGDLVQATNKRCYRGLRCMTVYAAHQ